LEVGALSEINVEGAGDDLREQVRRRYAQAAQAVDPLAAELCSEAEAFKVSLGARQYSEAERDQLPDGAVALSLGCGNPTKVADLAVGEVVLDLGSGGGIDVILSARRVGSRGHAYGVDMTDEMLELARSNAADAGVDNVTFLKGHIEDIPLPEASIDVIISNCVINLSVDKPAVFAEMARVLRPGGRLGISDVVADDGLSPAQRAQRGAGVGCVAGTLSTTEYTTQLESAGFTNISLAPTHQVAEGLHAAIIRAMRPVPRVEPRAVPT
jgi:SAM-dependent methyltransferase